jgi:long-chain acyl-CoA synthetase
MGFNLAVILHESAKRWPGKTAVISDQGSMTFAELDAASDRVAANLRRHGIEPAVAVGLQLPNIPQFLMAYFGILKTGGVVVPMNVMLKAPEIAHYLADSDARAVITSADTISEAAKGADSAHVEKIFIVGAGQHGADGLGTAFEELLAGNQPEPLPYEQRDPGDTAVILFTSGTTGRPKGVQLSHFQLYMNADAHRQGFEMTEADVMIAVAPMFHTLGLSGVLNSTMLAGGALRLMVRFDAGDMLEVIQHDRATIFHGVPTMYHALLQHPKLADYDTSSLRIAGSAGAALPAEFLDSFERRFGVIILELYGLTESGPVATFNLRNDRKPYSVGKPIWGVDMQVWDDEGRRLPSGKENVGEFVLRGHAITKGYYKNPEATAATITEGWLRTGDLGYQDEEGFYFIVDRKKDLIIRGGYNVYPREIEDVLYQHGALSQIAVVGIPDERLGEEVRAYCVLKPGHVATEQELISYAKERLAAYKYPRSIVFLDELPLGPTGKILKKELSRR